jgi:hypothetical protein
VAIENEVLAISIHKLMDQFSGEYFLLARETTEG